MTRVTKDLLAGGFVVLAVLAFAATHEGWNVWLIGGSHRWAAAAIGILGVVSCSLGDRGRSSLTSVLAVLGAAALVLFVLSLVTGSLTPLSLLVADMVLLWTVSTLEHMDAVRHKPVLH